MSVMRTLLLKGSTSPRLREFATRRRFVRRAVRRFMPGETLDAALDAAEALARSRVATLVTVLGENVTSWEEAESVRAHYLGALDKIRARGLDSQISIKLTQLGLDLGVDRCESHVRDLVARAAALRSMIWIDMESSPYVDVTLDLYRRLRREHAQVGVCLQAYLYRTAADLESLLPIGPSIRVVKGAYREPPTIAFAKKRDVDQNFLRLARRILSSGMGSTGGVFGVATHDPAIVREMEGLAGGPDKDWVEFEMLYGIKRDEQKRLAAGGRRVRVLISYGEGWFPWYMRRLAERPANVWFVVRNLIG
jgi:proline dehydrogenase